MTQHQGQKLENMVITSCLCKILGRFWPFFKSTFSLPFGVWFQHQGLLQEVFPRSWGPPNGIVPSLSTPCSTPYSAPVVEGSLFASSPRDPEESPYLSFPTMPTVGWAPCRGSFWYCRPLNCWPFACAQSPGGHLHLRGTLGNVCCLGVP